MSISFIQEGTNFIIVGTPKTVTLIELDGADGDPYMEYNNTTSTLTESTTEPANGDHTLFTYTSPSIYDFKNNTIVYSDRYTSNGGFNFNSFISAEKELTIKNLKIYVTNNDININSYLITSGGNSYYNHLKTILNCSLTFNLPSNGFVIGNLIGDYYTGTIDNCTVDYVEGSIVPTLNEPDKGWIVDQYAGYSLFLSITNCTVRANLYNNRQGGICGYNLGASELGDSTVIISNCHTYGNVIGDVRDIGGICGGDPIGKSRYGYKTKITIENCSSSMIFEDASSLNCGGICGSNVGFAEVFESSVSDITIKDCIFRGTMAPKYSGGICGYFGCYSLLGGSASLTITNCHVTSDYELSDYSGGICAGDYAYCYRENSNSTLTIEKCSSKAKIIGNYSGGIVAHTVGYCSNFGISTNRPNSTVIIRNCFSNGIIQGIESGGICSYDCGYSFGGGTCNFTIENCYSSGEIKGTDSGGLCGKNFGYSTAAGSSSTTLITNCYSLGAITGTRAGGICGSGYGFQGSGSLNDSEISCCYSVGAITPTISAGGILGGTSYRGTIRDTYCLNWANDANLEFDYGQGDMFGIAPSTPGNYTIANCSFNNGVTIHTFTPVTLETLLTNSLCYEERRCISSTFDSTAPFLKVFGTSFWISSPTVCLSELVPTNYGYCPNEVLNKITWSRTYGGETGTGECVTGNPTGTLERVCRLTGIWEDTLLKCTECSEDTFKYVLWPKTGGGDVAIGTCKSGIPTGPLERECQLNGVWEYTSLTCRIVPKATQKAIIIICLGVFFMLVFVFYFLY